MVNEFKRTVVHVHAQTRSRSRSVHVRGFTSGQKNCGKSGKTENYSILTRVLLKAGPRSSARDGSAARRPGGRPLTAHAEAQSWFSTFFFSSGKSTRMQRSASGWERKIDDGDFKFGYHFNNHLNPFRSFLSVLVAKWKTLSFSVYSSVDRTR